MVNITLRATSIPSLEAWAEALQLGAEDAAPAVAEALLEDASRCFDEERMPWGDTWAPLKPATIRDRIRRNRVGKIEQRDGFMRGSLFGTPVGRTPGVTTAEVGMGGAAAAYVTAQHFGNEHQPGRPAMPIRPDGTVDLPAALDAECAATIRDAIDARMEVARRFDLAAEE